MVYTNPAGILATPKNVLNGEPKYNLSSTFSTSHIPAISSIVLYQLDTIVPFSSTLIIERRGLIIEFTNDSDSKCPI